MVASTQNPISVYSSYIRRPFLDYIPSYSRKRFGGGFTAPAHSLRSDQHGGPEAVRVDPTHSLRSDPHGERIAVRSVATLSMLRRDCYHRLHCLRTLAGQHSRTLSGGARAPPHSPPPGPSPEGTPGPARPSRDSRPAGAGLALRCSARSALLSFLLRSFRVLRPR